MLPQEAEAGLTNIETIQTAQIRELLPKVFPYIETEPQPKVQRVDPADLLIKPLRIRLVNSDCPIYVAYPPELIKEVRGGRSLTEGSGWADGHAVEIDNVDSQLPYQSMRIVSSVGGTHHFMPDGGVSDVTLFLHPEPNAYGEQENGRLAAVLGDGIYKEGSKRIESPDYVVLLVGCVGIPYGKAVHHHGFVYASG